MLFRVRRRWNEQNNAMVPLPLVQLLPAVAAAAAVLFVLPRNRAGAGCRAGKTDGCGGAAGIFASSGKRRKKLPPKLPYADGVYVGSSWATAVPSGAGHHGKRHHAGNHGRDRFPSSSSSVTLSFCTRSRSRVRRRQGYTAAQNPSRRPPRSWCSPDGTGLGSGRTDPAPSSAHRCRIW